MAVLSIQSHVVYGYAGNTAAVFPLQRLGHEVWAINTVEFSNHTGFGAWRGKILDADLTMDLVTGLEERGVIKNCEAVLSGYLGNAQTGKTIESAVEKIRRISPGALYCCDPVMGDFGRGFYVKSEIRQIIKNDLVPLADIVFPNHFELQELSGINIENKDDALKALDILHDTGPSIILVTSFKEKQNKTGTESSPVITAQLPVLSMIASMRKGGVREIHEVTTPELPLGEDIAGTGDMTAAVFLSRFLKTGDLKTALELCAASVFGILEASHKTASPLKEGPMQIKIIDCQEQLANPSFHFKAEKIYYNEKK